MDPGLETLRITELRIIASQCKIKYYSRLKKSQLVNAIISVRKSDMDMTSNSCPSPKSTCPSEISDISRQSTNSDLELQQQTRACIKIQNMFRKYLNEHVFANHSDFHTLEELNPQEVLFWHIIHANCKIYRFYPKPLYEYILTTKKFENPYNRQTFSTGDLQKLTRLTRIVFQQVGDNPDHVEDLVEAKTNLDTQNLLDAIYDMAVDEMHHDGVPEDEMEDEIYEYVARYLPIRS